MTTVVAMVALAAACWFLRILLIVLVPADRLPARVRRALGHLAPAVLAALVAVEADATAAGSDAVTAAMVVGSLLLAGLAMRATGSLLLAIGVGIGAALAIDLLPLA
ncbi:MAG TPA: AzlD domain-containing protein [Nocardioidaceae bacterium]|nr:AzlD domain-containing protein [Nocardioidaceae bacterium]